MADREMHPIEAIHALVDGALAPEERAAVEAHLETCASCRSERRLAEGTGAVVRRALPAPELPPGLETRVRAALDADAPASAAPASRGWWAWLPPALIVALVVVVALVVTVPDPRVETPPGGRLVDAVARDFGSIRDGSLALSRTGADATTLEAFFDDEGIDFETRVFDLAMMGFELAGGRVRTLVGRPSALFAYRGPGDVLMLCRMYVGDLDELPSADAVLENDGISFQVHRRDGRTLVFWEEGEVVCVLVSDAPEQDVIDLAFAKAVKA